MFDFDRVVERRGTHASKWDHMARLSQWHGALEYFRGRQWSRARVLLERLSDEPDYARLASLYFGYLRELELRPPGEDWDAAFTLYEK